MMQCASLPVLPCVDAVIAGYYQGRDTFVPFRFIGPAQPPSVYVVRLVKDARGQLQLVYHLVQGEPIVCADWREARQVCKQLNQRAEASTYKVNLSQCSAIVGCDGWPMDL